MFLCFLGGVFQCRTQRRFREDSGILAFFFVRVGNTPWFRRVRWALCCCCLAPAPGPWRGSWWKRTKSRCCFYFMLGAGQSHRRLAFRRKPKGKPGRPFAGAHGGGSSVKSATLWAFFIRSLVVGAARIKKPATSQPLPAALGGAAPPPRRVRRTPLSLPARADPRTSGQAVRRSCLRRAAPTRRRDVAALGGSAGSVPPKGNDDGGCDCEAESVRIRRSAYHWIWEPPP